MQALVIAMAAAGRWNIDAGRSARENRAGRLPGCPTTRTGLPGWAAAGRQRPADRRRARARRVPRAGIAPGAGAADVPQRSPGGPADRPPSRRGSPPATGARREHPPARPHPPAPLRPRPRRRGRAPPRRPRLPRPQRPWLGEDPRRLYWSGSTPPSSGALMPTRARSPSTPSSPTLNRPSPPAGAGLRAHAGAQAAPAGEASPELAATPEAFLLQEGHADELAAHRAAWARAAARTPHGTPIELAPEDFTS